MLDITVCSVSDGRKFSLHLVHKFWCLTASVGSCALLLEIQSAENYCTKDKGYVPTWNRIKDTLRFSQKNRLVVTSDITRKFGSHVQKTAAGCLSSTLTPKFSLWLLHFQHLWLSCYILTYSDYVPKAHCFTEK